MGECVLWHCTDKLAHLQPWTCFCFILYFLSYAEERSCWAHYKDYRKKKQESANDKNKKQQRSQGEMRQSTKQKRLRHVAKTREKQIRGTPVRLILVKDGFCSRQGHQHECSVLRGDFTQNVPQLPAIPAVPSGNGGSSWPSTPMPDLLGACGISNRVLNQNSAITCSSLLLLPPFTSLLIFKIKLFYLFCSFFNSSFMATACIALSY